MSGGEAFCILPWIHLEVVPEGNAKICCVAKEVIGDGGRPMSVESSTIEEIRGSRYSRSVRRALASGERIPVCDYCWSQERRGETSQRHFWNKQFSGAVQVAQRRLRDGADPGEAMPLEYLQISVGNKCNLACRMCNASYSSRIEEDPVHGKWAPRQQRDEAVGGGGGAARRPRLWQRIAGPRGLRRRANWIDGTPWFEQPEFVEKDMFAAGSTLRRLYVTGGEPLFVPAFDRILDGYVARGLAKGVAIALNTNLFHNEGRIARAMDSLLRFQHCHVAPSIDGFGAVYEYIRYPARWDVVDRNIRTLARMARERRNLTFMLTTVAQAYNMFNLVDLLRFADELSLECKPHVLDGPEHLRPHVLPRELRVRAAEQLSAYAETPADPGPATANRDHASRISRYLRAIEDTPDLELSRATFVAFTRDLDESRGQSLTRCVPELHAMMDPAAAWRAQAVAAETHLQQICTSRTYRWVSALRRHLVRPLRRLVAGRASR